MEDGGWRHPTGNRPQLRVGGGGGGGNCREWAGKRTAAVPLARSGTLPQRRSAMESSSSREAGFSAGQQRDLLGSNMRHRSPPPLRACRPPRGGEAIRC